MHNKRTKISRDCIGLDRRGQRPYKMWWGYFNLCIVFILALCFSLSQTIVIFWNLGPDAAPKTSPQVYMSDRKEVTLSGYAWANWEEMENARVSRAKGISGRLQSAFRIFLFCRPESMPPLPLPKPLPHPFLITAPWFWSEKLLPIPIGCDLSGSVDHDFYPGQGWASDPSEDNWGPSFLSSWVCGEETHTPVLAGTHCDALRRWPFGYSSLDLQGCLGSGLSGKHFFRLSFRSVNLP